MAPKLATTLVTLALMTGTAWAETGVPTNTVETSSAESLMLGAQVMVTVEEIAGATTVGLNVTPFVLEVAFSDWIGARLWPFLNILTSERGTERGHLGAGLTLPIYLWGDAPANAWYVGPIVSYADNPVVNGSDFTVGAEAGLRWEVAESWTFNVAVHGGASRLAGTGGTQWVQHFGVFPSIGYWVH